MTNTNNYYFTFGSMKEYPYQYGYLVIKASGYGEARDKFKKKFGLTENGTLPFPFQYDQNEWDKIISEYGDYIVGICHEVIE